VDGAIALDGIAAMMRDGVMPSKDSTALHAQLKARGVLPSSWIPDDTGDDSWAGRPPPVPPQPQHVRFTVERQRRGWPADLFDVPASPTSTLVKPETWPFNHCERNCTKDRDPASGPAEWSRQRQDNFLWRIFPEGFPQRWMGIISDESIPMGQLARYGMLGHEWLTGGFSTHVAWSNFESGHPDLYSADHLRSRPAQTRAVRFAGDALSVPSLHLAVLPA
jgi:hypothetical protein